jgi:hypothetical protein
LIQGSVNIIELSAHEKQIRIVSDLTASQSEALGWVTPPLAVLIGLGVEINNIMVLARSSAGDDCWTPTKYGEIHIRYFDDEKYEKAVYVFPQHLLYKIIPGCQETIKQFANIVTHNELYEFLLWFRQLKDQHTTPVL